MNARRGPAARSSRIAGVLGVLALSVSAWIGLGAFYGLGPGALFGQVARVAAAPALAWLYAGDAERARRLVAGYRVGDPELVGRSSLAGWEAVEARWPGFHFERGGEARAVEVPFVYEDRDAPYLAELRARYRLRELVAGAPDEYAAMLRLGAWVGTRWDHGVDAVPSGPGLCHPAAAVAAGAGGARFWCEIAAKLAVQAAVALGWQARLVTISRDGYTWEHAVAELWSDQFQKWFVLDTDFNVVYEDGGVPLSAFELCHYGEAFRAADGLRVRPIAPAKPSLPPVDLLPFYRYVHIDLRNDWCSRPLRRGSPVGGDLATWWTARPSMGPVLTAKTRIDDAALFDWRLNSVAIHARSVSAAGAGLAIEIGLTAYSPGFAGFEVRLDDGPWRRVDGSRQVFGVAPGNHAIAARVLTAAGRAGPASRIDFRYTGDPRIAG